MQLRGSSISTRCCRTRRLDQAKASFDRRPIEEEPEACRRGRVRGAPRPSTRRTTPRPDGKIKPTGGGLAIYEVPDAAAARAMARATTCRPPRNKLRGTTEVESVHGSRGICSRRSALCLQPASSRAGWPDALPSATRCFFSFGQFLLMSKLDGPLVASDAVGHPARDFGDRPGDAGIVAFRRIVAHR